MNNDWNHTIAWSFCKAMVILKNEKILNDVVDELAVKY